MVKTAVPTLLLSFLSMTGCEFGGSTSEEGIPRQEVRVTVRPAQELSVYAWRSTRTVQVLYRTSRGRVILDSLVPAQEGSARLPTASLAIGATLDLTGRDSLAALVWTATTRLSAESDPTTPIRMIELFARAPAAPPTRTGIASLPVLVALPDGDSLVVELGASPQEAIHYTTDGSNPTLFSPRYSSPFLVGVDTRIRVIALSDSLYPSRILDTILRASLP